MHSDIRDKVLRDMNDEPIFMYNEVDSLIHFGTTILPRTPHMTDMVCLKVDKCDAEYNTALRVMPTITAVQKNLEMIVTTALYPDLQKIVRFIRKS